MRKSRAKQISFIKKCLSKPYWYNETITHPNWKYIKQAIAKKEPISMVNVPPKFQENMDKLQELRNWQYSHRVFAMTPPVKIVGVEL